MTTSLTAISGRELLRRLLSGEREFAGTRIPAEAGALELEPDYPETLAYLRGQDLRATPVNAERSDWRGLRAQGLFLQFARLAGIDLRGAALRDADFRRADLSGALLTEADLSRATMMVAKLPQANLANTVLRDADLYEADLSGATLQGADLSRAMLLRSVLKGTDLAGSTLAGVLFYRADLRGALGLDAARDLGTARFYRTTATRAELDCIEAAFRSRPAFDVRED